MTEPRFAMSRPPRLRRKLAVGGAGLMALAVVATVGFMYNASKNNQARADAIVQTREQLSGEHVAGEVMVGYKPATSDQTKQEHISRHGARLQQRNTKINVDVISVNAADETATLEDLKTRPDVAFAEPNFKRHTRAVAPPTDPTFPKQWGYTTGAFRGAWNTTTGAGAPLIALLDTGVDMTHPDLAANVAPGGFDEINNDSDPTDDMGHGTSTMGIIAEVTNNGIGGAGGCWTCKVMPIKVLDSTGSGSSSNIINGITYAADHGAKIINASLGGPSSSKAEAAAVAYAMSKGIIFISAVCEDVPIHNIDYPASYPGVIGVAALTQQNTLETWSCVGTQVKISAASTASTTAIRHGYSTGFQGTSASAPFVAAAAALLWAAHPTATRDQIVTALLTGADPCCASTSGGSLNVTKSMALLGTSQQTPKKGDVNADSLVNVFDLSYVLSKWATADAKADINQDGKTDVFDLSIMLSNWAP